MNPDGLTGGVVYYDGQFDDARLLINLIATAAEHGATLLNYAKVTGVRKGADGIVSGVFWEDIESGETFVAQAKVVINATGAFTDSVRRLAEPEAGQLISPSQGAHLVFDRSFLPGANAILVPHTKDGRVMFAIPWHGHTLAGTTDTPVAEATLEPLALETEIEFILETAGLYLEKKPCRSDILSVFAGIRPLARSGEGTNTAALSRDHTLHIDKSGLLNHYWRKVDDLSQHGAGLRRSSGHAGGPARKGVLDSRLAHPRLPHRSASFGRLSFYGSDASAIQKLMDDDATLRRQLDPQLPYTEAEIVWAAREEMARTVEDVLARRRRALFLNAKAAILMSPRVAGILAQELCRDKKWEASQMDAFKEVASGYLVKV